MSVGMFAVLLVFNLQNGCADAITVVRSEQNALQSPVPDCIHLAKQGEYDEACFGGSIGNYRKDFCGCKLANGPDTACSPTKFVLRERSSQCSSKGIVGSIEQCRAAASAVGLPTNVHSESAGSSPKGCYRYRSKDVYFNTHASGGSNSMGEPICGEGTVLSFESHCFDEEATYKKSYCKQRLKRVERDEHCKAIPGWTKAFYSFFSFVPGWTERRLSRHCSTVALRGEYDEACFSGKGIGSYRKDFCGCKLANGPDTACSPTKFVLRERSSQCSSKGIVGSIEQCRAAASALGLPTHTLVNSEFTGSYPKGCYKKFNTHVYFNAHASGGSNRNGAPVCGEGTELTFEAHCLDDEAYKKAWSQHCADLAQQGEDEPNCSTVPAYAAYAKARAMRAEEPCLVPGRSARFFKLFRYRSTYCEGKDDVITLDEIPAGQGVCLDGHCFDAVPLATWLKANPRHPLSRRPITHRELAKLT